MKFLGMHRIIAVLIMCAAGLTGLAGQARAQFVNCPAPIDLAKNMPEIVSAGGRLRGLMVLRDAQQAFPVSNGKCVPQLLRFYQNREPTTKPTTALPPMPGPTLRARLGDVVELTFLDQIDPLDYGNSIDRAENGVGTGCDQSSTGYPVLPGKPPTLTDTMPDCFHGSSTGNLHFHGTHTSPSSTADNVFIGVRPSPRLNGNPTITDATFRQSYDSFFTQCEQRLRSNNLNEWPVTWSDMPPAWTSAQRNLLQAYDKGRPLAQQLWPVDEMQLKAGAWPQWYIGSVPYCFILPKFPGTVGPQHAGMPMPAMQMGQSPGTHWYHAHKHGSTALNVSNGMAGAFIIEGDGYDGVMNAFYNKYRTDRTTDWTRQQPVMVVNQLATTPSLERGGLNNQGAAPFSINGQQQPKMTMRPGEVKLWRIVNASSVDGFYIAGLPAGFQWRQTAQDGVQFDDQNYLARAQRPVYVAPGNRIDLLVQAPSAVGTSTILVSQATSTAAAVANGPPATPFFTVVVQGTALPMPLMPSAPPRPSFLRDIAANEVPPGPPRVIVFNSSGGGGQRQHTIGTQLSPYNGVKFNPDNPLKIDKLNTVEEWQIYNTTTTPAKLDHPFHIHINPFQVVEVFSPNAPLAYSNGQVVYTTATPPAPVPLYVASTTQPALQPGQCWLNPNDQTTWTPCAATPPTAPAPAPPPPPSAATNIWWDVFPIPASLKVGTVTIPGYFKMRTRFVDYAGSYVMHCHILAHEDRGMMMSVEVASDQATMFQHH
jgi:FtsP/CotA-like multicopper oxidase with cupredoxin domain